MQRRVFLFSLLGSLVVPVSAAPPRPLILLFPTAAGRIATVTGEKPSPDGISDGDRITLAARAVREKLDEEKVADTLLFDLNNVFFQRAAESAKIKLQPGFEPNEIERVRLGAAVGAHYIVTVFSRLAGDTPIPQNTEPPKDRQKKQGEALGQKSIKQVTLPTENLPSNAPTLEVELLQLKPGAKVGLRWQSRVAMVASSDGGVRKPDAIPAGMESAARTLALRILGGPLREFSKTAMDPALLPPTAQPSPARVEAPPLNFEQEVTRLLTQAQELLDRERSAAAIPLLRQAVNYAPRKALPRLALAKAYFQEKRVGDVINESKRALLVAADLTAEQRSDFSRLMARALLENGDQDEATLLFTEILKANPESADARLGLAEILLSRRENDAAEIQYRLIRQKDPANQEAARGLARLLIAKGALEEAVKEAKASPIAAQNAMATVIFLDTANMLAARVIQNRAAWEEGKLSREIFFKATVAQSERAKLLAELLSGATPPETEREVVRMAHNRRVLAANLLAQAFSSLQSFLETGEAALGSRARTLITEFYTEMKDAQNPAAANR